MKSSGLSKARLGRMREVMAGHVLGETGRGTVPGLVTLVSRRGETHVEAIGLQEVGGRPMQRDTIFRVASLTKPIAAVAALLLTQVNWASPAPPEVWTDFWSSAYQSIDD